MHAFATAGTSIYAAALLLLLLLLLCHVPPGSQTMYVAQWACQYLARAL
jgi:hypothetical protein